MFSSGQNLKTNVCTTMVHHCTSNLSTEHCLYFGRFIVVPFIVKLIMFMFTNILMLDKKVKLYFNILIPYLIKSSAESQNMMKENPTKRPKVPPNSATRDVRG